MLIPPNTQYRAQRTVGLTPGVGIVTGNGSNLPGMNDENTWQLAPARFQAPLQLLLQICHLAHGLKVAHPWGHMAGARGSWLHGIGSQEAEMNSGTELAFPVVLGLPPPPPPPHGMATCTQAGSSLQLSSLEMLSQAYPEDIAKPVLGPATLRTRFDSHMRSTERPVRGLAHFTG